MLRASLVTILCFIAATSFSQGLPDQAGMYGADGGAGKTTINKSYLTPAAEVYWMRKFSRTFYLGATVGYQRYSFLYNEGEPLSSVTIGGPLYLRQQSGYVLFAPTADVGIGYRKYVHLRASMGFGVLADGKQETQQSVEVYSPKTGNTGYTERYYPTSNMPAFISHFALGLSERIPMHGYWNIMISQQFNYIPTSLTDAGAPIKTNYLALTVGIMHKYPMVVMED